MTTHASPSSLSDADVVRLSGPEGLVIAVPPILGFQPTESLVLVCLRGAQTRLGPVARLDLVDADEPASRAQLVRTAVCYADSVAVLCYSERGRPDALDRVLDALWDADVHVRNVLTIRDGLIREAISESVEALDEGIPIPGSDDEQARCLAAATALTGRRVLPDRHALKGSIAGPTCSARSAMANEIERGIAALDPAVQAATSADAPTVVAAARAVLTAVLTEHRDSGTVSSATAAGLIASATSIVLRDALIGQAVGSHWSTIVPALIAVVAQCPDEYVAEIGAVLAIAAYRHGDGALAHCAIDRVLSVSPHHRLAHLLIDIIAAALPPARLAAMAPGSS